MSEGISIAFCGRYDWKLRIQMEKRRLVDMQLSASTLVTAKATD